MTTDRIARPDIASAAIVQCYRIALGRTPEPSAIRDWTAFLNNGHDLKDLVADIAASAEFQALNGPAHKSAFNAIRNLFRRAVGGSLSRRQKLQVVTSWLLRRSAEKVTLQLCDSKLSSSEGLLFPLLYPSGASPLDPVAYRYWVADYEKRLQSLPTSPGGVQPLFTLILEAAGEEVSLLDESLQSVLAQTFPRWELLVVDESTRGTSGLESLREKFQDQSNIHWLDPSSLPDLLTVATGDFVAWLGPGDRLNRWALSEVARALAKQPQAAILYTDEDLMDEQGARASPVFKSAWSPDLLLAGDSIGGLAVLRRNRLQQIALDGGASPLRRFDLLLRLAHASEPDSIVHVPGPLYHRVFRGVEAPLRFPEQLANVGSPQLKCAIAKFLSDCQPGVELRSAFLGGRIWPRPRFPLPDPAPLVSVIIPTRDMPELLGTCITGILHRTTYPNLEVLIIDNDSSAIGTRLLFSQFAADLRVRVVPFPGEFNWSAANNHGAEAARGSVLLFLNNDIEISDPDWLRELVSHAVRPSVGVVGPKLYYKDGRVQHAGMVFDGHDNCVHVCRFADPEDPGFLGQLALLRDVSAVTGACMAVRKEVFVALGGFEQQQLKVTWSDVDLCLRARARKLRVVFTPFAGLRHLECATRGKDTDPERIARFLREQKYMQQTWGRALRDDPFVSPCLDATESGFQLSTSVGARWLS